jgi:hypothetical protein
MSGLAPEQIESEVEKILRHVYDTISGGEFEPWRAGLHDPPGRWLLGMEMVNIREASEQFWDIWKPDGERPIDRQEIDDLEIQVTAISPTMAYALCTSPDRRWYFVNGEVDRASTAETWVFVMTEAGWKLHSGQSAIFPAED